MAVTVEFDGSIDGGEYVEKGESFTHFFAEDELIIVKYEEVNVNQEDEQDDTEQPSVLADSVPFDGLSCTAFKLDKLNIGSKPRQLASFDPNSAAE
eukprot:CAMPEP_0171307980 /NCGR_PEP_ID=MMETSP0816-20121228/18070_1 /TAXON_ID=420281 /ORGANISM="Proboscia inermis, Strain CCAP1064/1" /LENGTH=95 /DNA_ID=CAMNT_0011790557 /DNA_START=635 /DNA_END=922 /DNA_ORIENTATION=+